MNLHEIKPEMLLFYNWRVAYGSSGRRIGSMYNESHLYRRVDKPIESLDLAEVRNPSDRWYLLQNFMQHWIEPEACFLRPGGTYVRPLCGYRSRCTWGWSDEAGRWSNQCVTCLRLAAEQHLPVMTTEQARRASPAMARRIAIAMSLASTYGVVDFAPPF